MGEWLDPKDAPYWKHVEVKVGRKVFMAMLTADTSMTEDEKPCDQWQALVDNYPRNWSGGYCWESNEDGEMSDPVEGWRLP